MRHYADALSRHAATPDADITPLIADDADIFDAAATMTPRCCRRCFDATLMPMPLMPIIDIISDIDDSRRLVGSPPAFISPFAFRLLFAFAIFAPAADYASMLDDTPMLILRRLSSLTLLRRFR